MHLCTLRTRLYGSQTRQLAHLIGNRGKYITICKMIPVEISETRPGGLKWHTEYSWKRAQQRVLACKRDRYALQSKARLLCDGDAGMLMMAMYDLNAGPVENSPRKRYRQQELGPKLQKATKAELDDVVADYFYGTGTPPRIVSTLPPASCVLQARSGDLPVLTVQDASLQDMLKRVSLPRGDMYTGPAVNALHKGLVDRA